MKKLVMLKKSLKNLGLGILEGFEVLERDGLLDLNRIKDCNYPSEMIESLFYDYDMNNGSNHYWYEIKTMLRNKEIDINDAASKLFDFNEYEISMILEEIKHYKRSLKKGV